MFRSTRSGLVLPLLLLVLVAIGCSDDDDDPITPPVTWTGTDDLVVLVNGTGQAVATGEGQALIIATAENVADTATVTVAFTQTQRVIRWAAACRWPVTPWSSTSTAITPSAWART